jgi:aminotransferase
LSRRVQQIPASGIRRYFDLAATMGSVISLGVGEPDFVTPEHIRVSAIESVARGETGYTSNWGMTELRELVAGHLRQRYGVSYDPDDEVLITVGVSEGLDLAMRAIVNPGDGVLVPDPGYVSYGPCVSLTGGVVESFPTTVATRFWPDPREVARRVTPETRAILLGYPNNPTGAAPSREVMVELSKIAAERDLIVISDEIYDRLVYGRDHVCFAALPDMRERTILLGGFSKAYAMTGWRVGYAAAPRELMAGLVKVHQYTALCASVAGQVAAIEALRHGEPDVQSMVAEYDRRRLTMVKGLREAGLDCLEPEGAFYAFPSVGVTGQSDASFAEGLLLEERVAVIPGSAFGEAGRGHVRCCYATAPDQIDEALRRIKGYVQRHAVR